MSKKPDNPIAIYEYLHTIPEIAWQEYNTSEYLAKALLEHGFSVEKGIGGTGVFASFSAKDDGPVIALCADMDALPFGNGKSIHAVHACGHDANCAMVLAAAESLTEELKKGTLKIIFQPAEENFSGAKKMIEHGVIDSVDTLLAIHLRPKQEALLGQATAALYHAASYVMDVDVFGVQAHAARPHLGCNALDAAALAIMSVNAIHLPPDISFSIKATQMQAGGPATNVIPDHAHIVFDVRAEFNNNMDELLLKAKEAINGAVQSIGAKAEIKIRGGSPAAEYNQETIKIVEESIKRILGENSLLQPIRTTGGDDFQYYVRHKPTLKTAYIGLGADLGPGLHNESMSFNTKALKLGVDILRDAVLTLSNK